MTKSDRDMSNDPMVLVSWYGAAVYCNWRSEQEGYQKLYSASDPNWACDFSKRGYRLATEAEWEYAARGGAWDNYADNCRIAKRFGYWPMHRGPAIGFRIVLKVE